MYVLGIAGTAKNTGKTTTTMALLKAAAHKGHRIALTSIGYDGENVDNVTGLPKPRIEVQPGSLVVTAEKCIAWGSARLEVLERIEDMAVPLGKICIAGVLEPGKVVIAGPNKGSHLTRVIEMVARQQVDLLIVDGALNRIGPMVKTHGIVLATGAARNPAIEELVAETEAFDKIFNLPGLAVDNVVSQECDQITVVTANGNSFLPISSLATPEVASSLAKIVSSNNTKMIIIPGMVDCHSLKALLDYCGTAVNSTTWVFQDPIKLLVGGNPVDVSGVLEQLASLDGSVTVRNKVPLYLITINPFYPAYSFEDNVYSSAYVDAVYLKAALQQAVSSPVIDVLQEPVEEAYELLYRQLAETVEPVKGE